jgi:hypothetical protein
MPVERDQPSALDDRGLSVCHAARLPSGLRLLCIGPQEPSWISLTLQLDAEGCLEPQFRWASSASEALTILRSETFDCLLLCADGEFVVRPTFDALHTVAAIRAAGYDEPLVLLSTGLDDASLTQACESDCDVLISERLWETPALVPTLKRAMFRVEMTRENRRLAILNQQRLVRERDEAEKLLSQQHQIIAELEAMTSGSVDASCDHDEAAAIPFLESRSRPLSRPVGTRLPPDFDNHYHELLRTYVIMGSGNMGTEVAKIAQTIASAGLRPRDGLQLHLERVESLVRGLGSRSTRHVMARADLMALELLIHLGECYRHEHRAAA